MDGTLGRRRFVRTVGATGIFALAGCTDPGGEGNEDGEDGEDDEEGDGGGY